MAESMSRFEKLKAAPTTVLCLVSFALFVEELLYGMVAPLTPVSPANIQDEHMLSTLYGAYAIGLILSTPILGIVTERIGRRKPMVLGVVLLTISAVMFWIGTSTELWFIGRILQGAGAACTWTAGLALVAGYYIKDRVKGMGYAMLGATTGSIVGPVMGGQLYDWLGYNVAFAVALAVLALDAVLIFVLAPTTKGPRHNPPWKVWFRELGGIVTDKSVIVAAFAVALAAASWALMEPLFPMHVEHIAKNDATPTMIGILFTVSNVLYAFCAPLVAKVSDHVGIPRTTALGLVMTALFLPLLALSPSMMLAGVVLCLITVGYAFAINPTSAELGDAVDRRGSKSYAVAYAVYNLSYSFGMIAADFYVEVATDKAHHMQLLYILLVMSALLVICVPFFLAKRNDAETPADPVLSSGPLPENQTIESP